MKKSPKQTGLERKIKGMLQGKPRQLIDFLFKNKEVEAIQNYANAVSIKRLGYNDHGPVHIRVAMLNAIRLFKLLIEGGITFNLVAEEIGSEEDSFIAVLIATFFHDLGMSVGRENHELMSVILAQDFIIETLEHLYSHSWFCQQMRSIITEGIIGHMGEQKIHSMEAGIVLVADGCDMTAGRARIPTILKKVPKMGDIHRYSASSIAGVRIVKGKKKPVRIIVTMHNPAGFFQLEEVLLPKINASPIKPQVELIAVCGEDELDYL